MNNENYEQEIKREKNSRLFVIIIAFLIFIIMVVGVSMAAITYTNTKNSINTISTGNVYMNYNEDSNGINITDAYPIADEVGKKLMSKGEYFDFSVTAKFEGKLVADYEIAALKEADSTLSDDAVKLYLEKYEDGNYVEVMAPKSFTPLKEKTALGTKEGQMLLYKNRFTKSGVDNYRLRMWVAEDAILGTLQKNYGVKVSVVAKVINSED